MHFEYNLKNARELYTLLQERTEALGMLFSDKLRSEQNGYPSRAILSKMLEHGKYPETQSKALCDAFDALRGALDELGMDIIAPLEIEAEDAREATKM